MGNRKRRRKRPHSWIDESPYCCRCMVHRSQVERYGWERCPGKYILWDKVLEREKAGRQKHGGGTLPQAATRRGSAKPPPAAARGPFAWIEDLDLPWVVGALLKCI